MARLWLGPWAWDAPASCWRMPAAATAAVDLRSVTDCGVPATVAGVGLFVTSDAANLGSSYRNYGTDPTAVMSGANKSAWKTLTGLAANLVANTLADALYETLTVQSDPTGAARVAPLVPTRARRWRVHLAGAVLADRPFAIGDSESTPLRDLLQRQYRAIRQRCLDGNAPPLLYRKFCGDLVRKYGIGYRWFQPADLPDEPDLPPETTITDNFNRLDSTVAIGTAAAGWSWATTAGTWGISGNTAYIVTAVAGVSGARAESDLSSADHEVQATCTRLVNAAFRYVAPAARYNAAATTFYIQVTAGLNSGICKVVSGTLTNLTSGTNYPSSNPSNVVKISCNGSTITGYVGGVQDTSITDTSITGNTRAGLGGNRSTSYTADDWSATDLGSSPTTYVATAALTTGAATVAGSATFSAGTKTASAAVTTAPTTAASGATFSAGTKTATANITTSATTSSGAATFSAGTKTATAAVTVGGTTSSGSATFSAGTKTATAVVTVGGTTTIGTTTFSGGTKTAIASLSTAGTETSAAVTFTDPVYAGTGTLTVAGVTAQGTGISTGPGYHGNAAVTTGATTASGSARFTAPVYAGGAAVSAPAATASSAAVFTAPVYTASATLGTGAASISASAAFAVSAYTGSSALASGAVTVGASGTFTVPMRTATAVLIVGAATLSAVADDGTATVVSMLYEPVFATSVFSQTIW